MQATQTTTLNTAPAPADATPATLDSTAQSADLSVFSPAGNIEPSLPTDTSFSVKAFNKAPGFDANRQTFETVAHLNAWYNSAGDAENPRDQNIDVTAVNFDPYDEAAQSLGPVSVQPQRNGASTRPTLYCYVIPSVDTVYADANLAKSVIADGMTHRIAQITALIKKAIKDGGDKLRNLDVSPGNILRVAQALQAKQRGEVALDQFAKHLYRGILAQLKEKADAADNKERKAAVAVILKTLEAHLSVPRNCLAILRTHDALEILTPSGMPPKIIELFNAQIERGVAHLIAIGDKDGLPTVEYKPAAKADGTGKSISVERLREILRNRSTTTFAAQQLNVNADDLAALFAEPGTIDGTSIPAS